MTYRRKDPYYRRAKAAGYRARSAYKLIELDDRYRVLAPGDQVVDLGAWPGGWLQVAAERAGPMGCVVGLDVVPLDPLTAPNVRVVVGDVRDPRTVEAVRARLARPADVVLSDLAPRLTGVRATDEARRAELMVAVCAALPVLLRPDGRLLMKLFMDAGYGVAVAMLRRAFATLKTTRPEATRRGSAELYAVGGGFRPRNPAPAF